MKGLQSIRTVIVATLPTVKTDEGNNMIRSILSVEVKTTSTYLKVCED